MKHLKSIGVISLIALFMIGCAPNKTQKKSRVTRGGGAVQNVTQTPQGSSPIVKDSDGAVGLWGEILKASNWTDAQFQGQVASFLSNLTEPDNSPLSLGSISGLSGQSTGIRFWGSVGLSTGILSLNGQANAQVVSQGSALRIAIIDSYVGMQNAQGETITEIPIYIAQNVEGFVGVTGQIQGYNATIIYQDGFGTITLQGQFNSNWFQGTVHFKNNNNAQGPLGVFSVQTCGFFRCQ